MQFSYIIRKHWLGFLNNSSLCEVFKKKLSLTTINKPFNTDKPEIFICPDPRFGLKWELETPSPKLTQQPENLTRQLFPPQKYPLIKSDYRVRPTVAKLLSRRLWLCKSRAERKQQRKLVLDQHRKSPAKMTNVDPLPQIPEKISRSLDARVKDVSCYLIAADHESRTVRTKQT